MSTVENEFLLPAGSVEIQATGKQPSVTILAYTGGQMTVPGWGPLVIDLAGIDVSASQIGILADHDSTLRGVVGYGRASVANGKLLVAGTVSPTTEAARQIIELARSGFAFQASVGVEPRDYQRIRPGELVEANGRVFKASGPGFTLVRTSVLREVSIVALNADAGTSVAIAASQRQEECMTTDVETVLTAEQIREQASAETERITAVRRVCGGRFGDIEARAIREGWNQQRTELEVLRASRPTGLFIHSSPVASTRQVIEAAIRKAWDERRRAREEACMLVPSSVLFERGDLRGEQVIYTDGHQIAAARTRGWVHGLEFVRQCGTSWSNAALIPRRSAQRSSHPGWSTWPSGWHATSIQDASTRRRGRMTS